MAAVCLSEVMIDINILMELGEGKYLAHILETSDYIMWFEVYISNHTFGKRSVLGIQNDSPTPGRVSPGPPAGIE